MKKIYHAGTLNYSLFDIFKVSVITLGAGFFYIIAGFVIVPTLLPLLLNQYGASGKFIALTLGSIPAFINMIMNPIISTASDRYRSKMGRRMPFLMVATPFVFIFLLLLGWAPNWLGALHGRFFQSWCSESNFLIYALAILSVLFIFANYIIGTVYFYLPPDVIPHQFMGRYMAFLQLVSIGAGSAFNFFLMDYVREYSQWIYTGIAVIFLLSFVLMFCLIQEGEYPPPEEVDNRQTFSEKAISFIKIYFRECMGHKIFVLFFLGMAITAVSTTCRNTFNLLFAVNELGITEGQYGKIIGIGSILALGAILLSGYLLDKIMPLWVFIFTSILVVFLNIWGYFFVVDYQSFYWVGVPMVLVYSIQAVSAGLCCIKIFPLDKYGQFCSANAMFTSVFMIIGNYLGGVVIDKFGYRFLFIWDFTFTIIATVILFCVYFLWRQMGGARGEYKSPI